MADEKPPISQQDVLSALLTQSFRTRPTATLLESFEKGIADATTSQKTNAYVLLCPRAGCASTILLANAAQLVEKDIVQLEPGQHPLLPALPSPPDLVQCWLVTPSPMAFENIGFSRPVPPSTSVDEEKRGKPLKLLVCADCELGPLGWCEEGGSEFWLVGSRVGYKV